MYSSSKSTANCWRPTASRTAKNARILWDNRYDDINNFERHLVRNGTLILKFFLHVSKEEQRKRFLDRIEQPQKHWKFSPLDVHERQYWDEYIAAYEDCLTRTSTKWAPWYVIPADHKWVTRTIVASITAQAIGDLRLEYPPVTRQRHKEIAEAKKQLDREDK